MRMMAMVALTATLLGCNQQGVPGGSAKLSTPDDSVSYILGYKMGENLKQQSVPVKAEIIFQGLKEGMAGGKAALTDSVMQATMMGFQARMMGIQHQKDSVAAIEGKAAGIKFLNDNKGKAGVKTTASGLQYKVLTEGTGPRPKATSTVTVQYKGTLLDGKQFDSSYDRGQPATFALNQVVAGWTEGLQLMNVGSKYEFYIPSDLGWGPAGSPPNIPPNSTVIFLVELISFK